MKLQDIQEASYRDQSEWVEWVRAQFDKIGPDPEEGKKCLGHERKVPVEELENIIKDLTRAFGKPETEDRYKDQHFQWVWELGGTDGYRIVAFPWDLGEIYAGICVGKNY